MAALACLLGVVPDFRTWLRLDPDDLLIGVEVLSRAAKFRRLELERTGITLTS